MKATVDHRARKQVIIANAIQLFARQGYNDVTFQDLADSSGIARTILYRYFKNKRQIFDAAIFLALDRVVQKHAEIMRAKLPASVRLRQVCTTVTATLFDNMEFLSVIIDFVMAMKRGKHDMTRRIMTFTIGLKRMLHTLLVGGIHHGEFRADVNPDVYTDLLYAQFESAVLRLTVSGDAAMTDVVNRIDEILRSLERK
jgi:AcrR family transcriptional regulator